MKFAIAAALLGFISAFDVKCPNSLTVKNFGADDTCDEGSLDEEKTKNTQENWDYLVKTF